MGCSSCQLSFDNLPPSPRPPSLPQRALLRRMTQRGNADALLRSTVPRRQQREKAKMPRHSKTTKAALNIEERPFSRTLRHRNTSPPRAWGRHAQQDGMTGILRNTPTCVGNTAPRPPIFRCGSLPAGSHLPPTPQMQRWRGREGDPVRPQGGRSAAAGADITPATGRGRFAPTPRATRGRQGTVRLKRQFSRYRQAGSTGVQGV